MTIQNMARGASATRSSHAAGHPRAHPSPPYAETDPRPDRLSQQKIADQLGVGQTKVWRALNPEALSEENRRRRGRKREWEREQASQRRRAEREAREAAGIYEPVEITGIIWIRNHEGRAIAATLVDEDTWETYKHSRVSMCNAYAALKVNGRREYLHRLILGLEPGSVLEGDHINRNKLDNRRANLRAVTCLENQANRGGIFEQHAA